MDITTVARLANLALTQTQLSNLTSSFNSTIDFVNQIQSLDTSSVEPTAQVTGLTNITREDKVIKERILTQEEALSNAKKSQNGYFVVPAIFDN